MPSRNKYIQAFSFELHLIFLITPSSVYTFVCNRWRRGDECILGVTGSGRPALRCARSTIFCVSSTRATMGLWENCLQNNRIHRSRTVDRVCIHTYVDKCGQVTILMHFDSIQVIYIILVCYNDKKWSLKDNSYYYTGKQKLYLC